MNCAEIAVKRSKSISFFSVIWYTINLGKREIPSFFLCFGQSAESGASPGESVTVKRGYSGKSDTRKEEGAFAGTESTCSDAGNLYLIGVPFGQARFFVGAK